MHRFSWKEVCRCVFIIFPNKILMFTRHTVFQVQCPKIPYWQYWSCAPLLYLEPRKLHSLKNTLLLGMSIFQALTEQEINLASFIDLLIPVLPSKQTPNFRSSAFPSYILHYEINNSFELIMEYICKDIFAYIWKRVVYRSKFPRWVLYFYSDCTIVLSV